MACGDWRPAPCAAGRDGLKCCVCLTWPWSMSACASVSAAGGGGERGRPGTAPRLELSGGKFLAHPGGRAGDWSVPVRLRRGVARWRWKGRAMVPSFANSTAMAAAQLHAHQPEHAGHAGMDFLMAPLFLGLAAGASASCDARASRTRPPERRRTERYSAAFSLFAGSRLQQRLEILAGIGARGLAPHPPACPRPRSRRRHRRLPDPDR